MNKGGTVLLTMEKNNGKVWSCPSFEFEEGENPVEILKMRMKEKLNIDIEPTDEIVYRHENSKGKKVFINLRKFSGPLQNNGFERVEWVDMEHIDTLDIRPDSKFAVIHSEIRHSPKLV